MNTWNIIIIVLAIVNILAFLSAAWAVYGEWKDEGKKDWKTLLMGLFFIPLCLFIAVMWPYAKYREKRDNNRRKREMAMRVKKMQEADKYHLQRFDFRLRKTPFKPSSEEIIYVENEYDERINELIRRNLSYIQECFDRNKYTQPHFVYLPTLMDELSQEDSSIDYMAPYRGGNSFSPNINLKSSDLLDYMLIAGNRSKITPCFARYLGHDGRGLRFECVSLSVDNIVDEKDFIENICSAFDYYPRPVGPAFQTVEPKVDYNAGADEKFDKESKQLIKEVEERISQLRKMGISQWALEQLVKPEVKLSKLVVTDDFRIVLPDYHELEIKMEPLVKAVYLLFLKHPKGIMFKYLPDYRKELTEIYVKLKPYGLSDRVVQSIEDVTNPLLNSINEKCARIRGAFVGQFDDRMARHYYIDGRRGEAKKIALPRDLVVWE